MKHIEWGFLIVNYLFLGGLSAGLYFLAALSTLLQREGDAKFGNIARRGAWLAPWPVMIGTAPSGSSRLSCNQGFSFSCFVWAHDS